MKATVQIVARQGLLLTGVLAHDSRTDSGAPLADDSWAFPLPPIFRSPQIKL
jgi:hypothetical protein